MTTPIYTRAQAYRFVVAAAHAAGQGAVKGALFGSTITSFGWVYRLWSNSEDVSMRNLAASAAVGIALPVACTIIGATIATLSETARFSRSDR